MKSTVCTQTTWSYHNSIWLPLIDGGYSHAALVFPGGLIREGPDRPRRGLIGGCQSTPGAGGQKIFSAYRLPSSNQYRNPRLRKHTSTGYTVHTSSCSASTDGFLINLRGLPCRRKLIQLHHRVSRSRIIDHAEWMTNDGFGPLHGSSSPRNFLTAAAADCC